MGRMILHKQNHWNYSEHGWNCTSGSVMDYENIFDGWWEQLMGDVERLAGGQAENKADRKAQRSQRQLCREMTDLTALWYSCSRLEVKSPLEIQIVSQMTGEQKICARPGVWPLITLLYNRTWLLIVLRNTSNFYSTCHNTVEQIPNRLGPTEGIRLFSARMLIFSHWFKAWK